MRFAALALLVSVACEAQPRIYDRSCDVASRRSDRGGVACASQFDTGTAAAIANANGVVCDCAQISRNVCTAAAPGILIAERMAENIPVGLQSPAYCTKAGLNSNIAVGDLVPCATNTPRIRPVNADGTGTLGPLSEPGRWNFIAVSDQFENAGIWLPLSLPPSPADPVVVNGATTGPDGTASVDLVYFSASSGGGESILYNSRSLHNSGCPVDGGPLSASIYLRGATDAGTGTGTLDLCTISGSTWQCSDCAFVPGSWTRCLHENKNQDTSGGVGYYVIGNASFVNGGIARPAQGVYVSKAQCEAGATATSPIDNSGSYSYRGPDTYSVQEPTCRAANARTAWLGDSLSGLWTVGPSEVLLTQRPPARYATVTGRTVDNWAHQGDELSDAILQWTNYGDRTRAQRIVIWVGINDIVAGANGTTLAGTLTTWVTARLAESKFVTIVNLAPFGGYSGWSAGKQTQADAFNSAIATYCAAHVGTTVCVDVNTPLNDGAGNLDPAYDSGDGLHFNQAGATLAGDTIAAASP